MNGWTLVDQRIIETKKEEVDRCPKKQRDLLLRRYDPISIAIISEARSEVLSSSSECGVAVDDVDDEASALSSCCAAAIRRGLLSDLSYFTGSSSSGGKKGASEGKMMARVAVDNHERVIVDVCNISANQGIIHSLLRFCMAIFLCPRYPQQLTGTPTEPSLLKQDQNRRTKWLTDIMRKAMIFECPLHVLLPLGCPDVDAIKALAKHEDPSGTCIRVVPPPAPIGESMIMDIDSILSAEEKAEHDITAYVRHVVSSSKSTSRSSLSLSSSSAAAAATTTTAAGASPTGRLQAIFIKRLAIYLSTSSLSIIR